SLSNMKLWAHQWDLFATVCKARWNQKSEETVTGQVRQFVSNNPFQGESQPDAIRDAIREFQKGLPAPHALFAALGESVTRVVHLWPYAGDQEGQQGSRIVELKDLLCKAKEQGWLTDLNISLQVDEYEGETQAPGLSYMQWVRNRAQELSKEILAQLDSVS